MVNVSHKIAAQLLFTFASGFLAAHLVSRWRQRKSRWVQEKPPSKHVMKKSARTDGSGASTVAAIAPKAAEDTLHVKFGDDEDLEASHSSPAGKVSVFSSVKGVKSVLQNGFKQREEKSPAAASESRMYADTSKKVASGKEGKQLAVAQECQGKMSHCRAPSGIPSDIQVPELTFGGPLADGTQQERPGIIPFSSYAPCRLLDVRPDCLDEERGQVFDGIRTMAAFYLKADNAAICECIQNFGLNDLLFSVARLEMAFKKTLRSGFTSKRESMIAQAAERVVDQAPTLGPKGAEESEAVRAVVTALMHELECILHEYLSYNWDTADDIYSANKKLQNGDLPSLWKSAPALSSCESTPEGDRGSSPSWDRDSAFSRTASNLSEQEEQPSSPGSERSSANGNGGMKLSSSTSSLAELVRKRLDESEAESTTFSQRSPTRSEGPETEGDQGGKHKNKKKISIAGLNSHQTDGKEPHKRTGKKRAIRNWQRARAAVQRKVTKDMLGPQRRSQRASHTMEELQVLEFGMEAHSSSSLAPEVWYCRFMTLQQMFEDMNRAKGDPGRQPVILLLGGGMAAGKSTVREIIGKDGFWSKVGKDAVVVEADAIKNMEGLFQSLSRLDMLDMLDRLKCDGDYLNRHMHEYSTKAAENMFVAAVNEQKDVIFDGTMTWAPFVQQTIAMVRDHRHNYKRGPGFFVDDEGNSYERYWEIDEDNHIDVKKKIPYRIELVGVTCDTGLAVARGIWRKIRTGRSVPVPSQLRSHRLFAENFESFANAADSATLYHTGSALTTFNKGGVDLDPTVIAHRSAYTRGELLINPAAFKSFKNKVHICDKATSRQDLYESCSTCIGKVPTTDEDQMSTLRHVFRAAHRKELKSQSKRTIPRTTSLW